MSDGKLHGPGTALAFCEEIFTAGENLAATRQGHQGAVTVFLPRGRAWVLLPKPAASSGLGRSQGHKVPTACRCTQGVRAGTSIPISSVIIGFSAACRSTRGQTACHNSTSCGQSISALMLPREVPSGSNARLLAFALASHHGYHCQLQQLSAWYH